MFSIFRNYSQEILDRLDSLEHNMFYLYERNKTKLNYLLEKEKIMSLSLEMLTREVAEQVEVTTSAILLIEGIAAKLAAAGTDEVKLAELAATLDASQAALVAAVVANTIAEDEVVVGDEVVIELAPVADEVPAASTGEFTE